MTKKTRFHRLVAVFGAFLAASVSMLGLGLATSQQVAGAAVSAGNLSLASGVQPEVWPQNTKASVVVNGNTVTTAVGQLPGWIFSLPDNWTAGSEITISAAPASGANFATPVPFGLNQDTPDCSNYVGFADFIGLLRNDRAVAVLLHAAVERDCDNNLVAREHAFVPSF